MVTSENPDPAAGFARAWKRTWRNSFFIHEIRTGNVRTMDEAGIFEKQSDGYPCIRDRRRQFRLSAWRRRAIENDQVEVQGAIAEDIEDIADEEGILRPVESVRTAFARAR